MTGASYAAAGVDVEAGERAVALMRNAVARAQRDETRGNFGGFVGAFDASALKAYVKPTLVTSTDGVGTKVAIAQAMGIHNTVGIDLVAMVVDDIVVCGAEPLFMTDYIATGSVIPERIAAIVEGIAEGCVRAGCALLGGETAEHPGLLQPDEYDIAGAGTGVVEAADMLGADRVRAGDVVIAMASSGLHSNGFSLARYVLLGGDGPGLAAHASDLGHSIGEELLVPTRIYALDCLALIDAVPVHAFSHITGGGLAANIARVIPHQLAVDIERASWHPLPIFNMITALGQVEQLEMERTFNMGIGMVAIVPSSVVDESIAILTLRGISSWVCGQVRERSLGEPGDAQAKGGQGGAVIVRGVHPLGT